MAADALRGVECGMYIMYSSTPRGSGAVGQWGMLPRRVWQRARYCGMVEVEHGSVWEGDGKTSDGPRVRGPQAQGGPVVDTVISPPW